MLDMFLALAKVAEFILEAFGTSADQRRSFSPISVLSRLKYSNTSERVIPRL